MPDNQVTGYPGNPLFLWNKRTSVYHNFRNKKNAEVPSPPLPLPLSSLSVKKRRTHWPTWIAIDQAHGYWFNLYPDFIDSKIQRRKMVILYVVNKHIYKYVWPIYTLSTHASIVLAQDSQEINLNPSILNNILLLGTFSG